jgi:hypothetical protein
MLRIDTWEPALPGPVAQVATNRSHYVRHAGQSETSLARLVKQHSVGYRCVEQMTAWAREIRGTDSGPVAEDGYDVLGWTSAAILRATLSSRLDALNPVAAFRLLDQPEIGRLERSSHDYVVLRGRSGLGNEWPAELSGAISALDIDLWAGSGPADLDGAVAIDFDTFQRRFASTEVAA